jgi:hypothetical protein
MVWKQRFPLKPFRSRSYGMRAKIALSLPKQIKDFAYLHINIITFNNIYAHV